MTTYLGSIPAAPAAIAPERVAGFRAAFRDHAAAVLGPDELRPQERIDAIASGEDIGLELAEELGRLAPFGAGNPAVTLPCGFASDGLPVGLQLIGPHLGDARLLRAAALFEAARPWADRRPQAAGL